jgi:sigma-B regulation protein RsbU (phosphoserine phosphatase)
VLAFLKTASSRSKPAGPALLPAIAAGVQGCQTNPPMFLLIVGLLIGAVGAMAFMPLGTAPARRRTARDEEKQQVSQERQLVVDFMHHMAEALGEGLTRQELHQRIVHAAILCSGALSACIFERTGDGQMRSVAVEGFFPPHRPLPPAVREKLATRAKFIEQVLKSESFPENEGIVGAVVQTGKGQLIADAVADRRVVRPRGPGAGRAFAHRGAAAVPRPVLRRPRRANSADGNPFTATDFSLMQSLAEQAALALHNAEFLNFQIEKRQLDLDLSLASGIQQMLCPRRRRRSRGWTLMRDIRRRRRWAATSTTCFPCQTPGSASPSRMSRARASRPRC